MAFSGPARTADPPEFIRACVGRTFFFIEEIMTLMPSKVRRRQPVSTPQLPKGTIEFSLFAPTISQATLIADFTDWHDRNMTKYADGTFRLRVTLPDGDYQYRFRVRSKSWFYRRGQWVTITDPQARRVEERTGNGIFRVRDGRMVTDTYVWRHDDKLLPPNNQLVIYEMHVADFSGGEDDKYARGQFKHIVGKLDYLAELGINAIELMPIKSFPGDYSWGYNPQHLFAPEEAYGPTEDLKRLIDECHARGMRVIFDGVYNHAHTDCPLAQIDHDYWFHHEPKDRAYSWGPQYNYEHYDPELGVHPARRFIGENIAYWVREFHIDGIRYDAARQIENYDAMRHMSATARTTAGAKPFINIAEYLPEDPQLVGPPESGKPMDAAWHDQYFWRLADTILLNRALDLNAIKEVIDPSLRGFTDCTQVVNYISNHDHRRLLPRLAQEGKIFEDYAFARAHLASTLLLTSVGIPMIWMGEEFGEYKPKTQGPAKIDWQLLRNQQNRDLFNHYKRMIALRKGHPALQQNFIQFIHEDKEAGILAFVRWTEGGDRVVVIANFLDVPRSGYHIPAFPKVETPGHWQDWIADRPVETADDGLHIDLGGLEAKVLVWSA